MIKFLSKLLIIPIILSCFSIGLVWAVGCNSDCECFALQTWWQGWFNVVNNSREINSIYLSDFLTIGEQKEIITKNDLNTAMMNLKKYCCRTKEWWSDYDTCKDDDIYFNDNSLNSPYLFDHLFDVIMRRLNWLTGENDIYKKTDMSVDALWKEWRDWINEQAESTGWSTPQTIFNKYSQIWNQSSPELGFDIASDVYSRFSQTNKNFLDFIKNSKVANALKNYKDWTLSDRYSNSCALAEFFYVLLSEWFAPASKTQTVHRLSNWNSCNIIIRKQIDGENKYVQLVARRASNLFISNYLEWYISYMYERQQDLQKLWRDSTDRFIDVARGVPCLQKKCNN